jgi:hypothetical protein
MFPMRSRLLPLGLGFFGALLSGFALAQEYPGGLVIPPLPVVPGLYPGGNIVSVQPAPQIDVNVTASIGPRVMSAFPEGEPARRRDCEVQTYTFGSDRRVRVYRC